MRYNRNIVTFYPDRRDADIATDAHAHSRSKRANTNTNANTDMDAEEMKARNAARAPTDFRTPSPTNGSVTLPAMVVRAASGVVVC